MSFSCPTDAESDHEPSKRCVENSNRNSTVARTRSERIVPWVERTRERRAVEKDPESSGGVLGRANLKRLPRADDATSGDQNRRLAFIA